MAKGLYQMHIYREKHKNQYLTMNKIFLMTNSSDTCTYTSTQFINQQDWEFPFKENKIATTLPV